MMLLEDRDGMNLMLLSIDLVDYDGTRSLVW